MYIIGTLQLIYKSRFVFMCTPGGKRRVSALCELHCSRAIGKIRKSKLESSDYRCEFVHAYKI